MKSINKKGSVAELLKVLRSRRSRPTIGFTNAMGRHEKFPLSRDLVRILVRLLSQVENPAELTTQEAANLLNVSRPFVIGQLEHGKIEYRMVGAHRRVHLDSLLEYKRRIDKRQNRALNELAAQAQELKLGY